MLRQGIRPLAWRRGVRFASSEHSLPRSASRLELFRLLRLAYPVRGRLAFACGCLVVLSGVSMLLPLVIGKLMDGPKDGLLMGFEPTTFYTGLGAVFVVGAVANGLRRTLLKLLGETIVAKLRARVMRQLLRQDQGYFDQHKTGDLILRLLLDAQMVSLLVLQNISEGLRTVLLGAIGVLMMTYVLAQLSVTMLAVLPFVAGYAVVYGRRVRALLRQTQDQVGEMSKQLEEQLSGTRTIQAFGQEQHALHQYSGAVRKVYDVGLREAKLSGFFYGTTGLIGNATLVGMLAYGSSLVLAGALTYGELLLFAMYAMYTGGLMVGILNVYLELMKGVGAALRVFEVLEHPSAIPPHQGVRVVDPYHQLAGDVVLDKVLFAYPLRPQLKVFDNLLLTIHHGEHVCLVGPSGSGKLTVLSLLLRFYDPQSGAVHVGGRDIREYLVMLYRQCVGYVQQEPALFSGTVRENVAFGRDFGDEAVWAALQDANASQFVEQLPEQLDTQVGVRGGRLSGGQRQRVALARTLIGRPQVLVLDEATLALDTLSEQAVAQALNKRGREGLTTILIAHRVLTIKHASRVVVFNRDGQVVESGRYLELVAREDSELNQLLRQNRGEVEESAEEKEREAAEWAEERK